MSMTFSQRYNAFVSPFTSFYRPKRQIYKLFYILQLVKCLAFYDREKRYPFRVELPCMGH